MAKRKRLGSDENLPFLAFRDLHFPIERAMSCDTSFHASERQDLLLSLLRLQTWYPIQKGHKKGKQVVEIVEAANGSNE